MRVRRQQAFFHQVEQIDAAGLETTLSPDGAGPLIAAATVIGGGAGSVIQVLRAAPFEVFHGGQLRCGMRPSAARTAAGVIGNCRTRTPMAL